MKRVFAGTTLVALLCAGIAGQAVTIETVPVLNTGNTADTNGYGAVSYAYEIGKYEVTAGQYRDFLNAIAATDTHGCYVASMDSDDQGCQITQNGVSGSFTYDFSGRPSGNESDWVDRPVNYVSFWNALRFINWLHNGQPTGLQDSTTTEDGAYLVSGYTGPDGSWIGRSAAAKWWLPWEDEWYKAAYHKNDGDTGNYWTYATGIDTLPGNDITEVASPGNNVNYAPSYPTLTIGAPYYQTIVGQFNLSGSPYGTFDQAGNENEWTESYGNTTSYRVLRSGHFESGASEIDSSWRHSTFQPDWGGVYNGFRVAREYVPTSVVVETVAVLNTGNTADGTGYGAVNYPYNIGKYEITADQYCTFLNAVAATDTYGLYVANMDTDPEGKGCQITQNGVSGSYTYDFSGRPSGTRAHWANRPVNHVSFWNALRFINWLHNGQPTGAQDSTTTEDGAYFVNGYTGSDGVAIVRKAGAAWFMPTEDEWYKAGYHKNDGDTGNYWTYATGSDTLPGTDLTEATNPGNNVSYNNAQGGAPYYQSIVGQCNLSGSPYGTFDQAGNENEWTESYGNTTSYRVLRSGHFESGASEIDSSWRHSTFQPDWGGYYNGFRVATEYIPPPGIPGTAVIIR